MFLLHYKIVRIDKKSWSSVVKIMLCFRVKQVKHRTESEPLCLTLERQTVRKTKSTCLHSASDNKHEHSSTNHQGAAAYCLLKKR